MAKLVTLLLPCLNEASTLDMVIRDVYTSGRKYFPGQFEILLADNGSTDNSLTIAAKYKFVRVISVPVRGYGAALHWGILSASTPYVLFADADYSYPFSNLQYFRSCFSVKPDLVLGSRLQGHIQPGAMPWSHRFLGTPILSWLIRYLYHLPVTDCNSGMRLVRTSFYRQLHLHNSGMEWASELILKTAIVGGKYLEVPIKFRKDARILPPHLSRWSDGWRHLKAIILMKPACLYPLFPLFLILALFSYPFSFSLVFFFLSLFYILILCLLALHLLKAGINNDYTRLDRWLIRFQLVPFTLLGLLLLAFIDILLPDRHLGTKLFLVNLAGITLMWLFLIETVKTHLVNRLPDRV